MTNRTRALPRGHIITLHIGRLCITYDKAVKKNVVSSPELERLELVRKLKEKNKAKKITQTDIVIEEITFRKW